jgi:hypothetical protein
VAAATFRTAAAAPAHLLVFHLCFLVLFLLAAHAPRSYAFTWLAGCLGLGFWLKMVAHTLFSYPYVEPVGAFAGDRETWNAALDAASAAALGVSLVRALRLWTTRATATPEPNQAGAPAWYALHRRSVCVASAAVVVAIAAANLVAAFYQTGVNPRITLPFHLAVLPAWWLSMGAPLWLALLLTWELRGPQPPHPAGRLSAVLLEMLLACPSMLSRGAPLPRLGGYLLVLAERRPPLRRGGAGRWAALAAATGAAFVTVIVLVSLLRIALYPPPVFPELSLPKVAAVIVARDASTLQRVRWMVQETSGLVVDRWVGMEGLLAVVSSPRQGWKVLATAFVEDPRAGTAGLYQQIARTIYPADARFTFLTLAGPAAIFRFSGSDAVVALGMAIVAALLVFTEELARRLTASELVAATAAVTAVHVVVQATIPYLTGIFFLELWMTLAILGALSRPQR